MGWYQRIVHGVNGNTLRSGHYVVDIKGSDGLWTNINDTVKTERVTPNNRGFIFICQKVENVKNDCSNRDDMYDNSENINLNAGKAKKQATKRKEQNLNNQPAPK